MHPAGSPARLHRPMVRGAGCSRRASARTGLSDSPAGHRLFHRRALFVFQRVFESAMLSPRGCGHGNESRPDKFFAREGPRRVSGAICPWRRERQQRTSPRVFGFIGLASQRRPKRIRSARFVSEQGAPATRRAPSAADNAARYVSSNKRKRGDEKRRFQRSDGSRARNDE